MKRKYTRKVSPDATSSKTRQVKGIGNGNLPPYILTGIEKHLEYREVLGLSDDREDRIERALRYQEFIRERRWTN